MSEVWAKWESEVINGAFPLRRFLGGSDHSGVFLTEYKAQNLPNAVIKLVPAIPTLTDAQFAYWNATSALSHPHLIRLLEVGRCRLGGLQFLFVVMEYAEQTLAQFLPKRALAPEEVREMLLPILAALGFLHRQHLVQGQLKPVNILVVGDQLKLASDTIRPAGESTASIAPPSMYDPPETNDGSFLAAGDIWGLGITIVEALTQHPPVVSEKGLDPASLPAPFPAVFAGIVRQCLSRNPADRPTVADLEAQLKPPVPAPLVPAPLVPAPAPTAPVPQALASLPESREAPDGAPPPAHSPKKRWVAAALAVALVILLAVWAGLRTTHTSQNPETSRSAAPAMAAPSAAKTADSTSAPSRNNTLPSDQLLQRSANDSWSVLHEEIPDVPRSARDTIHGRIKVAIRVAVDSSGSVISASLEKPGPSSYFARLATEAARKWKFAPADNQDSRKWLLSFEFTRSGVIGHASTRPS